MMSDKDIIKEKEIAKLLDEGKVVVITPSKGAVIVKTFANKLSPQGNMLPCLVSDIALRR